MSTTVSTDERPAGLCQTPNQHTRPSGRVLRPGAADLHGYQEFTVTATSLTVSPIDASLARKAALLEPFMQPAHLQDRTVLDLGANNGYFALLALQRGASRATAVDLDADCIANLEAVRTHLGLTQLETHVHNAVDWRRQADCVLALALSHWLGACTATLGSLDAVVGHLADLAAHVLVLEYVDASDPAIAMFGHLTWEGRPVAGYSRDDFEAALRRRFPRVERLGDMSATRSLYVGFRAAGDVDLRMPHPLAAPRDQLISCRELAQIEGRGLWSAVFDTGDRIVKQTTGRAALHEAAVLRRLAGRWVPRVIEARSETDWSTMTLEKVDGVPLSQALIALGADRVAFTRFVRGCFDVLDLLRCGDVTHRDIHEANVLVRDGLPVLIDFGWASAPGLDIEPPPAIRAWRLAMLEPGATDEHCDTRAMGRTLLAVSAGRHPDLETLFSAMAEPDLALRPLDTTTLRGWLEIIETAPEARAAREAEIAGLLRLADVRQRRAHDVRRVLDATQQALETERVAHALTRHELEVKVTAAESRGALALAAAWQEAHLAEQSRAALHVSLEEALSGAAPLGSLAPLEASHLAGYARVLRERQHGDRAHAVATVTLAALQPTDPSWPILAYLRASLDAAAGRADAALAGFRRVMTECTGPEASRYVGGAAFHAARLLEARDQRRQAIPYLERCLELIPDHRDARLLLETLA